MSKVIESREQLFFEIALLLASCKTPEEQQALLIEILRKTEAARRHSEPHKTTTDEKREVQRQLVRYYQIGFIRWGLLQKGKLITSEFVTVEGKLVWYNERSQRHEHFHIPHNLKAAFSDGWDALKKMAEETPEAA